MRLSFQAFDLEDSQGCHNDSITIYNGQIMNSAIEAIKCGHVSGDVFVQSRYLIAVFRSNSHLSSKGFNINVEGKTVQLEMPNSASTYYCFETACLRLDIIAG